MDTSADLHDEERTRGNLDLNALPNETKITLHRTMAKQTTNSYPTTTKPIEVTYNH